ncbi:MAG: nucleotidyltransferase family protein [Candidatus Bathyarchaeia archaeon]
MRRFEEIKGTLAKHKQELRRDFGVKQIGVFGSYVRGEQKKQSDIDLLVEFEEPSNLTLLDFIRLENSLSEMLGVKVDLIEKQTLKPRMGKHILEEVVNV